MRWLPTLALALLAACQPGSTRPDAGAADATPAASATEADRGEQEADTSFADALTGHRNKLSTADLDGIRAEGALRVITRNNSTSYFLYRGQEAGFDLEVARLLARELGLRLQVVVPPSRRDLVPWLLDGRGDIILSGLSTDVDRADRVAFSSVTVETPWVVVVRRDRSAALRALTDFNGKTLLVCASSGALKRVRALNAGYKLRIQARAAVETLEQEDLLDMVAEGEVDGAVLEKRVADVELEHREDLAQALILPGAPDREAWATRKENPRLQEAAEAFLARYRRGVEWNVLYRRYHDPGERTAQMREPEWRADRQGSITPFDSQFKVAARDAGLDWRLLAAQAYQESRFEPKARAPSGAVGLMQLMPSLARSLGVLQPHDPTQNLTAGARYMQRLMGVFGQEDLKLKDQIRFALASYNVGLGHVTDARRLAAALGRDPNRWFENVAPTMLLLSKPRQYRNTRHGYCRGEEPVRYVSQIQGRYDAYVALTEGRSPP